ncbi:hypothetical protein [Enterococcus sp. AZ177]|uniref:hypothetical protein n=1 Tax=unclassified Enterococcus TaxID=2608891 RepID=UPI003D2FBF5B
MVSKILRAIKKPIPVEAYQVNTDTSVNTLEGVLVAKKGDWILTGPNGDKWPVKNKIFKETYDILR